MRPSTTKTHHHGKQSAPGPTGDNGLQKDPDLGPTAARLLLPISARASCSKSIVRSFHLALTAKPMILVLVLAVEGFSLDGSGVDAFLGLLVAALQVGFQVILPDTPHAAAPLSCRARSSPDETNAYTAGMPTFRSP